MGLGIVLRQMDSKFRGGDGLIVVVAGGEGMNMCFLIERVKFGMENMYAPSAFPMEL